MKNRKQEVAGRTVRETHSFDYSLLLIVLCLLGFGLLMIYSSSSYTAQVKFQDSAYFLKKQMINLAVGIVVMIFVSRIDYRVLLKRLPGVRTHVVTALYFCAVLLQLSVYFIGKEFNGAKRWIVVGPVSIQPAEISKIAVLLITASFINMAPAMVSHMKGACRILLASGVLIVLVGKENLSSAIVMMAIVFIMCFVAARYKRLYFLMILVVAAGVALFILFGDPFRMKRFQIWLDVENNPGGFQILQGLYAIASGGLFGTGMGESMQKLGFIPEPHNDMIFAIICEELGIVGAGIVILMFLLLIWRIYDIAVRSPDLFSGMICTGVMAQIAVQVIANIAVVTNSIPSTGIALPFISYGGSSVIFLLAEIGLVLQISKKCVKT
ncbi:MAG: putative peptidoglycan glycosyltransferase FtsW [Eubacterium sp.]|nr:putative peptidoglycan glycosyltransferase FtsW [Eubacterium sp.]